MDNVSKNGTVILSEDLQAALRDAENKGESQVECDIEITIHKPDGTTETIKGA